MNKENLEELLLELQPKLYKYGLYMCGSQEDAEEMVQETLIAVCRNISGFRGESTMSTWAMRIARNKCINQKRRRAGMPKHFEPLSTTKEMKGDVHNPEENVITHELWQQVHEGIRLLKSDYKEVILMRDVEGMSTKEVADILEISVSAVKTKLHRARKDLRVYLDGAPAPQGCPDIRIIFSKHLEGVLEDQVCASMQGHISECSYCAGECDKLRELITICSISPSIHASLRKSKLREALHDYLNLP